MRTDTLLTERVIAFVVGLFLTRPRCRTFRRNDGDFSIACGSRERMRQLSDDVLFFKGLNERIFKLVGYKVATFGIRTFLQCVLHFNGKGIETRSFSRLFPERFVVGFGCSTLFLFRFRGRYIHRLFRNGRIDGFIHLALHFFTALHTLNFGRKVFEFLFHFCVYRVVFFGKDTVNALMGIKESVHRVQKFLAFFNHCV